MKYTQTDNVTNATWPPLADNDESRSLHRNGYLFAMTKYDYIIRLSRLGLVLLLFSDAIGRTPADV